MQANKRTSQLKLRSNKALLMGLLYNSDSNKYYNGKLSSLASLSILPRHQSTAKIKICIFKYLINTSNKQQLRQKRHNELITKLNSIRLKNSQN